MKECVTEPATPTDSLPWRKYSCSSRAETSLPSVQAFQQQQYAVMNDVVLLACTIGDLSWLRRGVSEGLDPCTKNTEVS